MSHVDFLPRPSSPSWIFLSILLTLGRMMNLHANTTPGAVLQPFPHPHPPLLPPPSAASVTATASSRVVAAVATWQFGALALEECAARLLQPGTSALDAVEAGINVVELNDAEQYYVGVGGLPNAAGVVECDAAVMDHRRRYGAVMGLTDIATPVSVARSVMEHSPHSVLSGVGAKQWALSRGFLPATMLTEKSRQEFVSWQEKQEKQPPPTQSTTTDRAAEDATGNGVSNMSRPLSAGVSGAIDASMPPECHDTVGVICLDAAGRLACGTSTSGWAFKHPGRVGDSPVVGAGLYCDGKVGAAVATGDGEEILRVCLSHLVVELMRSHMSPQEACREGIARLQALIDEDATSDFLSASLAHLLPGTAAATPSSTAHAPTTNPTHPPAQPRMHKQLTVGVIAMSPTGEIGAASTLGAHNVHRDRPGFPAVCWRRRVEVGGPEAAREVAGGGCGGVGGHGGEGGQGEGGKKGACGGGCEGSEVEVEVDAPVASAVTSTVTATAADAAGPVGASSPVELVKDLPSGKGSLYLVLADAQGASF